MNRPTWLLVVAGPTLVATFGVSSANGTPACPRSSTQLTASGVPAAHREIVRGAVGCVTAASGATPEEWSARLLAELRPLLAQQVARAAGPARAAALRHSAVSLGVLERDARSRLVASERVPLQRPLAGGLTGKASVFDQPNTDSQHVGGAVVLDAAVSDQAGVVASERRRWSTETQRCPALGGGVDDGLTVTAVATFTWHTRGRLVELTAQATLTSSGTGTVGNDAHMRELSNESSAIIQVSRTIRDAATRRPLDRAERLLTLRVSHRAGGVRATATGASPRSAGVVDVAAPRVLARVRATAATIRWLAGAASGLLQTTAVRLRAGDERWNVREECAKVTIKLVPENANPGRGGGVSYSIVTTTAEGGSLVAAYTVTSTCPGALALPPSASANPTYVVGQLDDARVWTATAASCIQVSSVSSAGRARAASAASLASPTLRRYRIDLTYTEDWPKLADTNITGSAEFVFDPARSPTTTGKLAWSGSAYISPLCPVTPAENVANLVKGTIPFQATQADDGSFTISSPPADPAAIVPAALQLPAGSVGGPAGPSLMPGVVYRSLGLNTYLPGACDDFQFSVTNKTVITRIADVPAPG